MTPACWPSYARGIASVGTYLVRELTTYQANVSCNVVTLAAGNV
jgi:hypothetical protein